MLVIEFPMLVLIVAVVVLVSSRPAARSAMLALCGTLGFGIILIGLICAAIFTSRTIVTRQAMGVQLPTSTRMTMHVQHAAEPEQIDLREAVSAVPAPEKLPVKGAAAASKASEPADVRIDEPIRIDEQTRAEIERQWRDQQVQARVRYTSAGMAGVLGLLAVAFGYLKLDALSGARYRNRLRAGAAGVILAVALAATLAAEGRFGF